MPCCVGYVHLNPGTLCRGLLNAFAQLLTTTLPGQLLVAQHLAVLPAHTSVLSVVMDPSVSSWSQRREYLPRTKRLQGDITEKQTVGHHTPPPDGPETVLATYARKCISSESMQRGVGYHDYLKAMDGYLRYPRKPILLVITWAHGSC